VRCGRVWLPLGARRAVRSHEGSRIRDSAGGNAVSCTCTRPLVKSRAAEDLVASMQRRKMRPPVAKQCVADKLNASVYGRIDATSTRGPREELDIGVTTAVPGCAKGIEAKLRIADLLAVGIKSLKRLHPEESPAQ